MTTMLEQGQEVVWGELHQGNGIVCGWRFRTSVGRQWRKGLSIVVSGGE